MLYIGVDAHSKTSWITIMDEKGKIVKREQINSSRKDVQKKPGTLSSADEGGSGSKLQLGTYL